MHISFFDQASIRKLCVRHLHWIKNKSTAGKRQREEKKDDDCVCRKENTYRCVKFCYQRVKKKER